MVSAWRNFKNIFSRPLFTIIFRPEMLKFHPYSIVTGDTTVGFVIFYVLRNPVEVPTGILLTKVVGFSVTQNNKQVSLNFLV